MCGRFVLAADMEDITELLPDFTIPYPIPPRYNIAPNQPVACALNSGRKEITFMQWGLVPEWAKDPSIGARLINARAETLDEKPSFRNAFTRRRCLIPASGFYEWGRVAGQAGKQPVFFRLKSGKPFAIAGLWEEWCDKEGGVLPTCAIITTRPNSLVASVHTRMPVMLDPRDHARWLYTDEREVVGLKPLLKPWPAAGMESFPVSRRVKKVGNDSPDLITPLPRAKQQELFPP